MYVPHVTAGFSLPFPSAPLTSLAAALLRSDGNILSPKSFFHLLFQMLTPWFPSLQQHLTEFVTTCCSRPRVSGAPSFLSYILASSAPSHPHFESIQLFDFHLVKGGYFCSCPVSFIIAPEFSMTVTGSEVGGGFALLICFSGGCH